MEKPLNTEHYFTKPPLPENLQHLLDKSAQLIAQSDVIKEIQDETLKTLKQAIKDWDII